MSRLRVAVVGLGVGRAHVMSFRTLPQEFDLVAVCDVDRARAEKVAEWAEVPAVYDSLDDLLARESLDVVDLATPPDLHFDGCRQVLATGRHVICEKPLVTSLALMDALAEAEAASGHRLMPIFQYRFGHGVQRLRRLVECGVTGRAYLSTVETAWTRGADYYAAPWRGRWASEQGGVLVSHAIHAHDLLYTVLGPARNVFARAATRVNPIETEDCAAASLEMADGSLATLSATLGSSVEISRLRFCFEHLTAESALEPYTPSSDPWTITPTNEDAAAAIEKALEDFEPEPENYVGQFARFARALSTGGPLPVELADARASIELATALYHSAETGDAVALPLDRSHPKYGGWIRDGAGPRLPRAEPAP